MNRHDDHDDHDDHHGQVAPLAVPVDTVQIGTVRIGPHEPLALIAGPCAAESREVVLRVAEVLSRLCEGLGLPLIYKSSYEKDNRTEAGAYRGPGLERGLELLAAVKASFGVAVMSDVHRAADVRAASEVLDVLQVPALLCRQTSLLEAVGASGRPVNLKKGQSIAPSAMRGALQKVRGAGGRQVLLTERGTFFGYDRLVSDLCAVRELRRLGCPVVFDAGHASNRPEEIPLLARCGVAAGADALFVECHPDPAVALCDGSRMLALDRLAGVLGPVLGVARAVRAIRAACRVQEHAR